MTVPEPIAHAAIEARDPRFDGAFFTGVTSTGVYCRCVCPARTPLRRNRRFFPSAAAAEAAGFRPCLVCRPEAAPGQSRLEAVGDLARRALQAIEAGALEERGLDDLAADLGASARHVRRATAAAFGASPVQLAQTQRLLVAKRLLQETRLPITEIAFASGFASVRRFNALFLERYGLNPAAMRRGAAPRGPDGAGLTFRLAARGGVMDVAAFGFLAGRALGGIEAAAADAYARTWPAGEGDAGALRVTADAGGVRLHLSDALAPQARVLIGAVRRAFDLDADIAAIDAHLARDPLLAGDVASSPCVRLTAGLDPFEIAVRAILGQQVTLEGGRRLVERLADKFGQAVCVAAPTSLTRLFPTPARLADATTAQIASLGVPGKRAEALRRLAADVAEGRRPLRPGGDASTALADLPGVGPWTIAYVALRGFVDPDAFPAGDAALRAATGLDARALADRAEAWRPFRGYAAVRLWRRAARLKDKRP